MATGQTQVATRIIRWDADGNKGRPINYLKTFTSLIYGKGAPNSTQIAASTSGAVLWDRTASGEIFQPSASAGFTYAFFEADAELLLEMTCNTGGATAACFGVTLVAQVPLVLGSPKSMYNVTNGASASILAGTAGVITRFRVSELNGNTVNLRWDIQSAS